MAYNVKKGIERVTVAEGGEENTDIGQAGEVIRRFLIDFANNATDEEALEVLHRYRGKAQ